MNMNDTARTGNQDETKHNGCQTTRLNTQNGEIQKGDGVVGSHNSGYTNTQNTHTIKTSFSTHENCKCWWSQAKKENYGAEMWVSRRMDSKWSRDDKLRPSSPIPLPLALRCQVQIETHALGGLRNANTLCS
jgi:hypothetical protein